MIVIAGPRPGASDKGGGKGFSERGAGLLVLRCKVCGAQGIKAHQG